MKKFFIKTLGCKTNQLESAILEEKLLNAGFVRVNDFKDSEIFILNSCSVTHTTDNDSLKLINQIKNFNKNIFVVLTGCFAQLQAKELGENANIDLILGNDDKFDIVEYINKKSKICVSDIMQIRNFNFQLVEDISKTRANLKIQDGCNNRCAYCTIPFARGYSRSNSIENVIKQIEIYVQHNFQEIILTGIHIGQWGQDLSPKKNLIDLLAAIEKSDIKRYRLGSLNPLEITDDLLEFLSKSEKFCPHFHLSLQSANNKILNLMNRKYRVEDYLEQIKKINTMFNLPFLGADIIVGFPKETDEDFEITKNNLQNSGLSKIHVFPYSKRSGTVAYDMDNQVKDETKKQRAKILQDVSKKLNNDFMQKNLNTVHQIMIEKKLTKDGYLKGISENYINVITTSKNSNLLNTIQKVRFVKQIDDKMEADII